MLAQAAAGDADLLDRLVTRRCAGEPLELVAGFADFAGVRVSIAPGVFVPRHRSAGLVDIAVGLLQTTIDARTVVDLGCGTGALLAALLARVECEAYAVDTSDAAVECARRNLAATTAKVLQGDYFDALPRTLRGRIGVVLANLPYVPSDRIGHLPREARLYEPLAALDGGADGLAPYRRVLGAAGAWLRPGGSYLCELSGGQLQAAEAYAVELGYSFDALDDDQGGALIRLGAR